MTAKKQKEKDRRRARKLADQAWDAVNDGNLDMAEKIIRRAVATQADNPILWHDQGAIQSLRNQGPEAEKSLRTALSLAPNYADALASLAALRFRHGSLREALALQQKAVQAAPESIVFTQNLELYRTLVKEEINSRSAQGDQAIASDEAKAPETVEPLLLAALQDRLAELDWESLGLELTQQGSVLLPRILDEKSCQELSGMFESEVRFAKTVVMDRNDFGRGCYRYFRAPIPYIVDSLRRIAYRHVAAIANQWQVMLRETKRFPADWESFRDECKEAGQTTPTPILLKYGTGGFNALHRDLRGKVFFPIQLAVILSPIADSANPSTEGFSGGEFQFCDVPSTPKSRNRSMKAGLGDAILFCTRDRLVSVGGFWGLQPVKHGVARITAGTRFVLGVPFHEYR